MINGDHVRISTASAIDLAGSEDNRRTENGKERMVESASINKSLFTLAKCVEAISQGDARIPYRESKMTRILSLGQNNGLTTMILNLAPIRSYHLDTISSLNFANRTKRIEVREIENEQVFKACPRAVPTFTGTSIRRQPLRPLASMVHNVAIHASGTAAKSIDKQSKAFSVYSDRRRLSSSGNRLSRVDQPKRSSPLKRPSDPVPSSASRPPKRRSPYHVPSNRQPTISKQVEDMIERKVTDILAARALDQPSIAPQPEISGEVQRRLEVLEQKIEGKGDGREQGLTFLLMAKQHAVRGEDASALRMYVLAKEFFPDNSKLDIKIDKLQEKMQQKKHETTQSKGPGPIITEIDGRRSRDDDEDYQEAQEDDYASDGEFRYKVQAKKHRPLPPAEEKGEQTPRTTQLLDIVNTRDIKQLRLLKGVGAKKAEALLDALCACDAGAEEVVTSLGQMGRLKGVGAKTVENMRAGLQC